MKNNKFPMWTVLSLEIQSLCNRNCKFCPRYYDRSGIRKDNDGKRINKKMPTEKVYKIIDEVSHLGFKNYINFHRQSEPFLDNRYVEFATYAKSKGMYIAEHTNGDILKNNAELCRKIDGLVDELIIGLYDHKNYREKKQQMNFWNNIFKHTKITFSSPVENTIIRRDSKVYFNRKKFEETTNMPCSHYFERLLIRYDGNVCLCNDDTLCSFDLGNVFNQKIEDIWWSDKRLKLFKELHEPMGRHKYKLCKNCYYESVLLGMSLEDWHKYELCENVYPYNGNIQKSIIKKFFRKISTVLWKTGLINIHTYNYLKMGVKMGGGRSTLK